MIILYLQLGIHACIYVAGTQSQLLPVGEVHTCPGETQVYTCRVSGQLSPLQLEWRVHFEDSLSEPDVIQSYISSDPVGQIQRDHRTGYSFTFNLTSSGSTGLVSTMTIIIDVNIGTLINPAAVNCGREDESSLLRIHDGNETN